MDGNDQIYGYNSGGGTLGTNSVDDKEVSDLLASMTNNLDLDSNRIQIYERDLGPADRSQSKSGGVQQGTVEFIDFTDVEADEDKPLPLDSKTNIAKSKVVDQIDLYEAVDTDEGDDFDFDLGGDLNADDFGMFSILSSHIDAEADDDGDLDQAYDEEVGNMFSDLYSEADALTEEVLNEGSTLAAPKMGKFLTSLVTAKEVIGAGA